MIGGDLTLLAYLLDMALVEARGNAIAPSKLSLHREKLEREAEEHDRSH